MRKTHALIQVAVVFIDDPGSRHWGYDLSKRARVRSGVLYPLLQRLLDEGWLRDGWEDSTRRPRRGPPRRFYELTDKGRRELGALLAEASSDPRFHAEVQLRGAGAP